MLRLASLLLFLFPLLLPAQAGSGLEVTFSRVPDAVRDHLFGSNVGMILYSVYIYNPTAAGVYVHSGRIYAAAASHGAIGRNAALVSLAGAGKRGKLRKLMLVADILTPLLATLTVSNIVHVSDDWKQGAVVAMPLVRQAREGLQTRLDSLVTFDAYILGGIVEVGSRSAYESYLFASPEPVPAAGAGASFTVTLPVE